MPPRDIFINTRVFLECINNLLFIRLFVDLFSGTQIKIMSDNLNISSFKPGQVVDISKNNLSILTGNGVLSINRLQLEGKKSLDIKSFLNGYIINIGDSFGN